MLSDPTGDENWFSGNLRRTFGELDLLTAKSVAQLQDDLRDLGLPTMPGRNRYPSDNELEIWEGGWWQSLWAQAGAIGKTTEARTLFEKVRFYEVTEIEWLR